MNSTYNSISLNDLITPCSSNVIKIVTFQGTTYKRVIPQQEINSNERDKFWQKEEEEEKIRQELEKKRKDEERRKLESEIKQREVKQHT